MVYSIYDVMSTYKEKWEKIFLLFSSLKLLKLVKIADNMQNTKMKEEMRPQDLSNRNQSFKIPTYVSKFPYQQWAFSDLQVQ